MPDNIGNQTWLDRLLGRIVKAAGTVMAHRSAINFTGTGVTVTDDEPNDQTTIDISGGGGGGGDNTITVAYTGTAPLKGQWVCMASGADADVVTLATLANLKAAGRTRGIAISNATGGVVHIATDSGTVDASVTGLALPGTVGIDPVTARSVLLTGKALSGAEFVGGNADNDGKLTVCQWARQTDSRSPPHYWSPLSYGAKADGSINANGVLFGTDDTQAWVDMQADMTDATEVEVVHLPPGLMYMGGIQDTAHGGYYVPISKHMHLRGNGGGSSAPTPGIGSGFALAPMVRLDFLPGGSGISFTHWDHINIYSKSPIVSDTSSSAAYLEMGNTADARVVGRTYAPGMCCLKTGVTIATAGPSGVSRLDPTLPGQSGNDVMFRCVTGGTVTGSIPSAMSSATVANIGDIISDTGGVTWRVEALPKDRQHTHAYVVGEQVVNPGDTRFVYECVVAGTTGDVTAYNANTGFIAPTAWDTFVDGTVTWRVIRCGVIMCLGNETKFTWVTGYGGMGYAFHSYTGFFHVSPDTDYQIGDHIALEDCRWKAAGGMLACNGPENTHTKITRCVFNGAALFQRTDIGGDRGVGDSMVWDRTVGGLYASNLYGEFEYGPAFVSDSTGGASASTYGTTSPPSTFLDCRQEGHKPNHVVSPAIFIGSSGAQGFSSTSTACLISSARTRNVKGFETDAISGKVVNFRNQSLVNGVVTHPMQGPGETAGGMWKGWWYERLSTSLQKVGLFMFGSTPENGLVQAKRWSFGSTSYENPNAGGYTSGVSLVFDGTAHTITRASGSFLTDGFVAGDSVLIKGTASNDATKTITVVTATVMTFASGLTNETVTGIIFGLPEAGPGIELMYEADGHFDRSDGKYHGADAAMLPSVRLRYGLRKVGDSFPLVGATYAVGTPRRGVVTVQGYRGERWTASLAYYAQNGQAQALREALLVEPDTSPLNYSDGTTGVWALLYRAGANPGTQPTWPSVGGLTPLFSTFQDSANNIWLFMGLTAVVVPYEFIYPNTHEFRWAAAETAVSITQADLTTNGGTGAPATFQAQNETGTTSTGGEARVTSGTGTTKAGAVKLQTGGTTRELVEPKGTTLFNGDTGDLGGGDGVLGIHNAVTAPSTNPTNGGVFYVEGGALKYRGKDGTVTTLAPA